MTASITIQPATPHVGAPQPYPFHVDPDTGAIGRQDYWKGNPAKVIGFARSLDVNAIDLTWADAVTSLNRALGMYVVTADADNRWSTHTAPIQAARRNVT